MRTLAIGDVHGCLVALETLLHAVKLTASDRVVFLGDYIDRGPNSKGVVSRVSLLVDGGQGIALRGNHEVMVLSARTNATNFKGWLMCGGDQTLNSYGAAPPNDWRACVPPEHWIFYENTKPWFETETHLFVHASVSSDLDLGEQSDHTLYWQCFDPRLRHKSGKTLVCGHTMQGSGWPAQGDHSVCIDTGAFLGEWLTCLDVASGKFWQANERCAVRTGALEPAD